MSNRNTFQKMFKFVPVFQACIHPMKFFVPFLILGFLPLLSGAQTENSYPAPAIIQELQKPAPDQGTVQIIQDPRIEEVLGRYYELNRRNDGIPGYRILIFKSPLQNSREKAMEERSRFISHFGDIAVYYFYVQPESRLFVGDFRTKSEALRMKAEIDKFFKNAVIIETKINFPKLDKLQDIQ